jgi:4-hydroxyphenylpyruvate dioxygenase
MRAAGVVLQDAPGSQFDLIKLRQLKHSENVQALPYENTLVDSRGDQPIIFEIMQYKGNEGCGEGSFKALFESIELDRLRRGVLQADRAP